MRIGCCVERIEQIVPVKEIGYDFVDLPGKLLAGMDTGALLRLKLALAGCGMECRGLHSTIPPEIRLVGPRRNERQLQAYARSLVGNAVMLGVRFIGIGSPRSRTLPDGFARSEADGQLRAFLAGAGGAMAQAPLLLVEHLHPGVTNYINTLAEANAVVADLPPDRAGVVLDLYHFLLAGEAMAAITPESIARVHYLHIADPAGRAFPSERTDLAVPRLLERIRRAGYGGDITVEAESRDFLGDAETALHVLRKQWKI